ncbi:DNA-binding response regulator [Kitasatospora phosalacinea]|uniref:DNA-binding response regulator n=1 Tax=Kitasatospora phosalacinea TaxID=2065 RepID=A0A9W6QEQ0_9ACTN|nr:response regulator [Kitasatospora phosalacinea]GLW74774.1 DNA-binding response regulator [Kitasatospora phosalacinea]
MTRILVVDDEPQMLRTLKTNLHARRYAVLTAATGAEALDAAGRTPPDAVLLDLGLPDLDGMDIIRGLRAWSAVPIIVLSGRTDAHEKVEALDAGADDYLTKPFVMDELLARLRAVMRRPTSEPAAVPRFTVGAHTVDLAAAVVTGPGGPVRLTPTEWKIMRLLLASPGRLVSGKQLLREVWGPDAEGHGNYLRVYLAGLRRKLEPDPARPRHLITEPGIGYRFEP